MTEISIVVPVYFAEKTVEALVDRLLKALSEYSLEIILVNDGSKDNSPDICLSLAEQHKQVKTIILRKNFGEHNAVMCGLAHSSGKYVAIIDDDLQNSPKDIIVLLEKAKEGYDVVFSSYKDKKHSPFRNFGSWLNGILADLILDKPKGLYLSSFKIIKKEIVSEIIKYRGPFPYIDGLIFRTTQNASSALVEHTERQEGKSNYTLNRLIRLHLRMLFGFSMSPIRFCSLIGFGAVTLATLLGATVLVEHLFWGELPVGWTSLMITILFFGGTQLIVLGILGEYLGKHYLDHSQMPQYVIKECRGLNKDSKLNETIN